MMKVFFAPKAILSAVALSVAAVGVAVPANAETRSVKVEYGDLDLASAEGKTTLQGRLKGAVRTVCGAADNRNLKEIADVSNCEAQANQTARKAVVTIMAASQAGTAAAFTFSAVRSAIIK